MSIRCLSLALLILGSGTANAGPVAFSTRLTVPILFTDFEDPPFAIISEGTFLPFESGILTVSFDSEDLISVPAPEGITARFELPERLQNDQRVADVRVELKTPSGRGAFGGNLQGLDDGPFPGATFDIIAGPIPQLQVTVEDFDGFLRLSALDPTRMALTFGALTDPVATFMSVSPDLIGLVGTFEVIDQGSNFVGGFLLQNAANPAQPVPEPASVLVFLLGAAVVGRYTIRARS